MRKAAQQRAQLTDMRTAEQRGRSRAKRARGLHRGHYCTRAMAGIPQPPGRERLRPQRSALLGYGALSVRPARQAAALGQRQLGQPRVLQQRRRDACPDHPHTPRQRRLQQRLHARAPEGETVLEEARQRAHGQAVQRRGSEAEGRGH
jgi:hypothetical protein